MYYNLINKTTLGKYSHHNKSETLGDRIHDVFKLENNISQVPASPQLLLSLFLT